MEACFCLEMIKLTNILTSPVHKVVQGFLDGFGMGIGVIEFDTCTKSSELAAAALGVEVGQIAKTMVLLADEQPVLLVTCGDVKINTNRLRKLLGVKKVKLADFDTVEKVTGYRVGGVCPFNLPEGTVVLLDKVLERYGTVYAAGGTDFSAVPVSLDQLQVITKGRIIDLEGGPA